MQQQQYLNLSTPPTPGQGCLPPPLVTSVTVDPAEFFTHYYEQYDGGAQSAAALYMKSPMIVQPLTKVSMTNDSTYYCK